VVSGGSPSLLPHWGCGSFCLPFTHPIPHPDTPFSHASPLPTTETETVHLHREEGDECSVSSAVQVQCVAQ
jgi:hypothetical protein